MICTLAAQAQLNGDGYYRVKSSKQGRYARVLTIKEASTIRRLMPT